MEKKVARKSKGSVRLLKNTEWICAERGVIERVSICSKYLVKVRK